MSKIANEKHYSSLSNAISEFNSFVIIRFHALTVCDLDKIRVKLRQFNASFLVLKNTIAKIVLRKSSIDIDEKLFNDFNGSLAIVCSNDPFALSKLFFGKKDECAVADFDNIVALLAVAENSFLDIASFKQLASMPSIGEIQLGIMRMLVSRSVSINRLLAKVTTAALKAPNAFIEKKDL